MNAKHQTPPTFLLSSSFQLTHSVCFFTGTFYALTHSTLCSSSLLDSFSSFLPYLLQPLACVFKTGKRETDWPLQGPKAWGNPGRIVGLLCPRISRLPTAPCGKVRPPVCIQQETLDWIIMLTGEEELSCICRGKHGIKMFCCRVPLKELLLASPARASMWVMRTPVGMFSAWLQQHKTNVTWKGTIFNENQ